MFFELFDGEIMVGESFVKHLRTRCIVKQGEESGDRDLMWAM